MFCCCGEGIFEIMFGMLLRWLYNLFSILEDWSFQWANDHWGYHRPLMFDETFWESTTANNHTHSLSLLFLPSTQVYNLQISFKFVNQVHHLIGYFSLYLTCEPYLTLSHYHNGWKWRIQIYAKLMVLAAPIIYISILEIKTGIGACWPSSQEP